MSLFRATPKQVKSMVPESPQQRIVSVMTGEGYILALFSKEGEFLTNQMGFSGTGAGAQAVSGGLYLAMNLSFVQNFGNLLQLGLYDATGVALISPQLASHKLLHQFGEDTLISVGSKADGPRIEAGDYDGGVLLSMLKLPKEWVLPQEGQLRVKLRSAMIFNPMELETFLLRVEL